jgi:hypothetical protein
MNQPVKKVMYFVRQAGDLGYILKYAATRLPPSPNGTFWTIHNLGPSDQYKEGTDCFSDLTEAQVAARKKIEEHAKYLRAQLRMVEGWLDKPIEVRDR